MTKFFAVTNLSTFYSPDLLLAITITGQLNLLTLIDNLAKSRGIEEALETDEIGGDPAHVAHLSPEELASDRAMIGEMLHDRIHKDVDNYRPVFSKEKE